MSIADRLKLLREEQGFNKKEVSEKLGIPYTTYNGYETGQRMPGADSIKAFADMYGVTMDYLMGRTENRKTTVLADDGLHEDNVIFKSYSEIYDMLRRRLVEEKVISENEELPPSVLKLFFALGEDMAMRVLHSKGIDEELIAALIADHRF